MTTLAPAPVAPSPEAHVEVVQHSLGRSALLHLAPGAALTGFIVAANALFGLEPLLGLLVGVLVVLAPLELGYLSLHAKKTTGSWSPYAAVSYRSKIPWKHLCLLAVGLAAWMIALTTVSLLVIDEWLATSVFAWLPNALLTMSSVSPGEEAMSIGVLIGFLALFVVANGIVGPVTEELYFRGHLLPRIEHYGRGAPVLNTALFTLYHFHTPWRYPVIFLGYLPIAWASWRKQSMWIGLAAHLIVNNVFILIMLASYLSTS